MLIKRFTVVFLQDSPPTRMVLLERGSDRGFAPNRFTGVGGKIDGHETPLDCALRELKEENGISSTPLTEFAKMVLRRDDRIEVIHYFTGWDDGRGLPCCSEGRLYRVPMTNVFLCNLIPSTRLFMHIWASRGWHTGRPFTLVVEQSGTDGIDDPFRSQRTYEGLNGFEHVLEDDR